MKVEMKFCTLLGVSCILLLPLIAAEDEATTAASDNVATNALTENAEPEPEPQTTQGTKTENKQEVTKSGDSTTEGNVEDDVTTTGLKLPPEAKGVEEEKASQRDEQTTPGNDNVTPAADGKDTETTTGENGVAATKAPSEKGVPSSEKPLLKTLSDLTDQTKVNQPSTDIEHNVEMPDQTKVSELKEDDNGKINEIKIADLKEDKFDTESKVEQENKDQEQQEVNLVFPTDLVKKDDEFEKMSKMVKPNKDLDEALAKELESNWTAHMDHNKEDEQPNFVFESQDKNKKIKDLEEKIEPETGIKDDSKIKKKDSGMGLPTKKELTGKDNTRLTTPVKAIFLDESVENPDLTKPQKDDKAHKDTSENSGEEIKPTNHTVESHKMGRIGAIKREAGESNKEHVGGIKKDSHESDEHTKDHKEIDEKHEDSGHKNDHIAEPEPLSHGVVDHKREQSEHNKEESHEDDDHKKEQRTGEMEGMTVGHEDKTKDRADNKEGYNPLNKVKPHSDDTSNVNTSIQTSQKDKNMPAKLKKILAKQRHTNRPTGQPSKPRAPKSKKENHEMSEEDLMKHAMKFEKLQSTSTELPAPRMPLSPDNTALGNQSKPDDDGTNVNTTLLFTQIIFRHGDRYKGQEPGETFPKDPYAEEDPFWLPYGCSQIRNKGKMRAFWLGQYLRKRYNGFLGEEYYHNDVRITSADLNRCIDSAHMVATGLYPPKGINIWNDNVGRFYQPLPVRTLDPTDDIYLNEQLVCHPYEEELGNVLNKKMKNFNTKYKYVYEYLEMYTGMSVRNLEDVAKVYTTLRLANENGRALPEWVSMVFPNPLKTLNSYYNQIRFSSHFFKQIQAGPLLTIILDELKQKSINRLKPNYKIKFWSGFDTTILKLLYTMKETKPSLEKAEELLETDYSGVLMIELHLVKKKHYVKAFYINMDPLFFKSHAPRTVQICDGLTLCPLEDFLARMEKYRISQREWYEACNMTYCKVDHGAKIAFN